MSSIKHYGNSAESKDIDALYKRLLFAFAERGYEIDMLVLPKSCGSIYCSVCIRPVKTKKSFLGAFGFYYVPRHWELEGYDDYYADRCVELYERFETGQWNGEHIELETRIEAEKTNREIYDTSVRVKSLAKLQRPKQKEVDPLS